MSLLCTLNDGVACSVGGALLLMYLSLETRIGESQTHSSQPLHFSARESLGLVVHVCV